MKIAEATPETITGLWGRLEAGVGSAPFGEEAAQQLAAQIYEQFSESVVIARVFLTVPFDRLPPPNKEFVKKLMQSDGPPGGTPVLSLIGTAGQEANWNDRRKSEGHVGIPLVSADFVGKIPMISRLLKELGVPIEWIDSHDAQTIVKTLGQSTGVFFVEDAGEATDARGRKIIAAQDFVSKFGVKTVFGTGGSYAGGEIAVIVVFCRDTLPKSSAENFLELKNLFQSKTAESVKAGKVFSG